MNLASQIGEMWLSKWNPRQGMGIRTGPYSALGPNGEVSLEWRQIGVYPYQRTRPVASVRCCATRDIKSVFYLELWG